MKQKFLTAFLFGATVLASTSTFVSCKDYSDEIDNLQTQIDNANALHATKAELQAAIQQLTADYQAADAKLNAAITELKTATEANAQAILDEVKRATAAEAALQAQIDDLKAADVKLQALIDDLDAKKVDKTTFNTTVEEIYARIAACSTTCAANLADAVAKLDAKDADLQKQITDLATELREADKVLQANINTVDQAVKDLTLEVASNKAVLLALKADFEQQKAACEAFQAAIDERVKAIEADYLTSADKKELEDKIEAAKQALQAQIDAINEEIAAIKADVATNKANIAANKAAIEALAQRVTDLETEVARINEELVALNLLIKSSLRSLVFIPDSYYWGVEATEVNYLEYTAYALPAASINNADEFDGALVRNHTGLDKDGKELFTEGTKVLSFAAKYHINPASASIPTEASAFKLITADKDYVRTATEADALLSIKGVPTAANGILTVNLDVEKPELINSVPVNSAVTIFATEVTLPADQQTEAGDVKVTSDYATVYKSSITGLVMAYAAVPAVANEDCGPCEYYKANSGEEKFEGMHLFASEKELLDATQGKGLYTCDYLKEIDLAELIETHYADENETHILMNADKLAAAGLEYKFELVQGLANGQSEFAAIDGTTFRPQAAEIVKDEDGKTVYNQKEFGAEHARASIGRTPVIRVTLVDAEDGTIYDYGYISIQIIQDETAEYDFTGADINYYYTCETPDFVFSKDIEKEILADYLKEYDMTYDEFKAAYTNNGTLAIAGNDVAQFVKGETGYTPATKAVGTIVEKDGKFVWTITGEDIVEAYYGKAAGEYPALSTTVKYESKDKNLNPDIYINLSTGKITVAVPSAIAFTNDQKIDEYWYKVDGNSKADGAAENAGADGFYEEIHLQTYSPEDSRSDIADVINAKFASVFEGGKIWYSEKIVDEYNWTTLNGNNTDWNSGNTKTNPSVSLYFSDKNNKQTYAALDGTKYCTYTLEVSENGLELLAVAKNGQALEEPEAIATITEGKADDQVIALNKESEIAKALLNYAAHNKLDTVDGAGNKVFKAIIMMKATNDCDHVLALDDNTFDVRFLRPINVTDSEKALEDAKDAAQVINIKDLLTITDWRDYSFDDHADYWSYYNIKSIRVIGTEGTETDANINDYIMTSMNKSEFAKTQAEVSNDVLFTADYTATEEAPYGVITYKNLGVTVQTFTVQIPVMVEYEWGYVRATVTVTVNNTHSNAKRR